MIANQLTKKPQNFSTSDNLYTVLINFSNVYLHLVTKTLQ